MEGTGSGPVTLGASARVPRRASWELSQANFHIDPPTCRSSTLPFPHCSEQTVQAPYKTSPSSHALSLGSSTGLQQFPLFFPHHQHHQCFSFHWMIPTGTNIYTCCHKTLSWPHFSLQLAPHLSTPLCYILLERVASINRHQFQSSYPLLNPFQEGFSAHCSTKTGLTRSPKASIRLNLLVNFRLM